MMLFLRALVILGAVLAVLSCGFATSLDPTDAQSSAGGAGGAGGADEGCTRIALTPTLAIAPTAGGAVAASSGTGLCL
jgi:hypothetical protein